MTRIKLVLIIALTAAASSIVRGQDSTQHILNPVQITVITPLGTNGLDAWNTTNAISINLLAGYNGGLDGVEIGGYLNVLKGNMNGVQLSGFGNANFGTAKGVEMSGFFNLNADDAETMELAGFTNVNLKNMTGLQASGFANASLGQMKGIQLSGFANYTGDDSKVIQGAGFANINRKKTHGVQLAGFANLNGDDSKSLQAAGFSNITFGDLKGVQLSGFLNAAGNVRGTQIGVFNYADSISNGVAIGFLSFVRKGYHVVELGFGETLNTTLSFKTGTRRFYNILSIGAGINDGDLLWGWGYGIGTLIPVSKRVDINVDVISYQVNEDFWFNNRLNLLNKLHINGTYRINKNLSVYGGPAFNVLTSDVRGQYHASQISKIRHKMYDKTFNNINIIMYPGFTAGLRF